MTELSPAEKYAQMRRKKSAEKQYPAVDAFMARYTFPLDDFQIQGAQALERGDSVLVAAPTGAGKTIVGEFAAYFALSNNKKCFYTTPIKALSNQKYNEFVEMFGSEKVGLLTGDTSINSEADIVVMTTEVLRNMLYSGSSTLNRLTTVVMDEVHYLADRFRGAVWEEVLIHLPESVNVAALSATVSNAEEFGEWLGTVRGTTTIIVSENRPVPLFQHVLFSNRLLDLFDDNKKVNPEVVALEKEALRRAQSLVRFGTSKHGKSGNTKKFGGESGNGNIRMLSRPEVVEKLERESLLPAIFFIFSRAGCDGALQQCTHAGLKLTTSEEQRRIRDIIHSRTSHLPEEDLALLGFYEWSDSLERGIATHHAGLLPSFKETVEDLFQKGLCKVVFSTETLALGVNMPARTVILEKLTKWNGQGHVTISPGEYTQLTGRAGRRGIDIEGNAVIQWYKDIDSSFIASLASTRTYPLRSSFTPSYNMAINLVSQMGKERARHSLDSSFAQFQADAAVVGLVRQREKNSRLSRELVEQYQCHLGDFSRYSEIIYELKELEKDLHLKSRRVRETAEQKITDLRAEMRHHPSHSCPDKELHLRYSTRVERLRKENLALDQRINSRTSLIGKRFDRLLQVLEEFGYIDKSSTTPAGKTLASVYGEKDLLIVESMSKVNWQEFNPAEFVAFLSTFLFESRGDKNENGFKIPKGKLSEAISEMVHIWAEIHQCEIDHDLEPMSEPNLGFVSAAHRWANGHSLTSIIKGSDLTVGDFVRSMKQVLDLSRQMRAVYPQHRDLIDQAITRIDRGVVSYTSGIEA